MSTSPDEMAQAAAVGRDLYTPNYRPAPVIFERGDGVWLYDTAGKRYLDFAAGIAVAALGHNHPRMTAALQDQASKLLHVSNLFFSGPPIELARRLVERSFADRVYFANSGTEANEAALKMARRYMRLVRGEDRFKFICAEKSFHGRTWASISATGQPKYHVGFEPLVPGFVHVPYNDLAAIEAQIDAQTCAIFLEPLQGEGGLISPEPGYLEGVRALCDKHGVLLIFDEVQTGMGRTGSLFAYEWAGAVPDLMTLAKGLGGGVPVGALLCTEEVAKGFAPGAHASTFGGNPLACRAGLAVFDTLDEEALLSNCEAMGALLVEGLSVLAERTEGCVGARGRGLLTGLVVDPELVDRAAVMAAARERGLLMTLSGADVLRLTPPLIVGPAHIEEALEILAAALEASRA